MTNHREHLSSVKLRQYINDELSEQARAEVEQELYTCDECMERFQIMMDDDDELLDVHEHVLAMDLQQLENQVIAVLHREQAAHTDRNGTPNQPDKLADLHQAARPIAQPATTVRRPTWLRHPVTHYAVAASITLILVASGTFTELSERLRDLDAGTSPPPPYEETAGQSGESWSGQAINRADSWLDRVIDIRFNDSRKD